MYLAHHELESVFIFVVVIIIIVIIITIINIIIIITNHGSYHYRCHSHCHCHYDVHAGLMLVLLYGREGWFAPLIRATGFNIVFAFPGQPQVPLPFRQGIQLHNAYVGLLIKSMF